MKQKEVESLCYGNKFLWLAVLLVIILTSTTGLAGENQNSCSINITIAINRDEKVTDMSEWSFVLLSKFDENKNYYSLDLASSDKSGEDKDKDKLKIDKVEDLKEDHYYELYDTSYSGAEKVIIGLFAINDDLETGSVIGFNSKSLNFNCGKIFPKGSGSMSMLQKDEFKIKIESNKDTEQPTTWQVSIFTHQSAYDPGATKRTERAITAVGTSLWLGLATYLFLGR